MTIKNQLETVILKSLKKQDIAVFLRNILGTTSFIVLSTFMDGNVKIHMVDGEVLK